MIVLSFMKQISNSKLSSSFDIACICLGCSVKLDVDMQYCCSTVHGHMDLKMQYCYDLRGSLGFNCIICF